MKEYLYAIKVINSNDTSLFLHEITFQKQPANLAKDSANFNVLAYNCSTSFDKDNEMTFVNKRQAKRMVKNIKRFRKLETKLIPTERWARTNFKFKVVKVPYDPKHKTFSEEVK